MKQKLGMLAATVTIALMGCGVSKQIVAEQESVIGELRTNLTFCKAEVELCRSDYSRARSELDRCADARAKERDEREACLTAKGQIEVALRKSDSELNACRSEKTTTVKRERTEDEEDWKEREEQLRARLRDAIKEDTVHIARLAGGLSVRIGGEVLFPSGGARISPGGRTILDGVASALKGADGMLRVEGHTDNVPIRAGSQSKYETNWELSAARASSVVRYFQTAQGIDPARMEVVGRSAFHPIAPNDTSAGRQKNRRVEIIWVPAQPRH